MNVRGFFALATWVLIIGLTGPCLGEALEPEILRAVYPGAGEIGPFEGSPSAAIVTKDGKKSGYIISTADVIKSTGYGGEPIDVIIGVNIEGVLQGAYLRKHNEPILVIGITDEDLRNFVNAFAGTNVLASSANRVRRQAGTADAISGATISSAVIRDAVIRGARTVLRARAVSTGEPRLAMRPYTAKSWPDLLEGGEIASRSIVFSEVPGSLGYSGDPGSSFADLYATLLTPPRIGGNLLGKREHDALLSSLGPNDHAVLIAANGYYSFKGRDYRRTGVFDRIQIVQGTRTIPLRAEAYRNLERLKAEDTPELREIAVFTLEDGTAFDPASPWRLDLFVHAASGAGSGDPYVVSLGYELPAAYADRPAPSPDIVETDVPPLWQEIWRDRTADIAGVVILLTLLTVVLVFQDNLVRYRRFRDTGRLAFLSIVLVWLGWTAGGQLSVLQVVTFGHALLQDFRWEHFLVDPVIFLLWGFVAITLLFWGRGVYCGWLCPFGAMQELINTAARRLGIPQMQVPFAVHERLWAIKYVIFLGLFAVSLHTVREAMLLAEVEPFKTAISLTFIRQWPFVLYALALLAAGLFIERFFCRYLCPLGAALAIPARLRMFNWLRRRHQCGRECQICSERCTVQAIHPTGEINPNECIYCLECQTYYMDDHICPPLVAARKKRERRLALASGQAVDMREADRD